MKIYIIFEQAEFVEDSDVVGVFLSKETAEKRAVEIEEESDPFWGKLSVNAYDIEDWEDFNNEKVQNIS